MDNLKATYFKKLTEYKLHQLIIHIFQLLDLTISDIAKKNTNFFKNGLIVTIAVFSLIN